MNSQQLSDIIFNVNESKKVSQTEILFSGIFCPANDAVAH